jgi:hypothetical protein
MLQDNFYRYARQGATIEVSKEFKRCCPECGEEKSIAEFGLRRMKPGELRWRDQPMCGTCRGHSKKHGT